MRKIINPWKDIEGYFCFGCAQQNEAGLKMEFYEDGEDIVSIWHPEAKYQGWLNTMHGGIQATLLDEICAWVIARKLQTTGVTSHMETKYMRPVMTTEEYIVIRARIREQKRNLVLVDATIYDKEGKECTKATCTYFTFTKEKSLKDMYFNGCDTEGTDENPLI